MKSPLISSLTVLSVLGLSQPAKAYNLEACAKDPMTGTPQTINLLQPVDQKMLNCIPKLDSIANQWQSKANSIVAALDKVRIGNNGISRIEKLEYNVSANYISGAIMTRAAHTWKVKECAVPRMVTTYRTVKECAIPKIGQTGCAKKVFGECIAPTFGQVGCNKWIETKVPSGVKQDGCNKWLETSASASTTCTYEYTFNFSTGEFKPIFKCGRGSLGEYKLDASAITSLLKGEIPSLGSLLTSVSFTPPLFKDANRDDYQNVRNGIISSHPNSIVYFSSESFVKWASVENQGANVIVAALSGGGYSAELVRQIEQKLRTELTFMSAFASQTAINLGSDQIISMMTGNSTQRFGGYNISVKVVNTPYVIQKCVVNGDCLPEIKSPRLGFAIIATPTN